MYDDTIYFDFFTKIQDSLIQDWVFDLMNKIQLNIDLRDCDLRKNLNLRKIVPTTKICTFYFVLSYNL